MQKTNQEFYQEFYIDNFFKTANNFITERNWWHFHNFKNASLDISTEAGELAEQFIFASQEEINTKIIAIADEISDVLFATIDIAIISKINICENIGKIIDNNKLNDQTSSFNEIQELVLNNLQKFNLNIFKTQNQNSCQNYCTLILSLIAQISYITDLFIWYPAQECDAIAKNNHELMAKQLAIIFAHLILLANLLKLDIPTEFMRKMAKNAIKYPIK